MSYMGMGEITPKHFEDNAYMFEQYIPRYDEIWLFGAGEYATAFYKFLYHFGVEPAGFVVSDLSNNCLATEKTVIDIKELKIRYQSSESKLAMLLTVSERFYSELMSSLGFMGEDLLIIPEKTKQCASYRFSSLKNITLCFPVAEHCNLACYSCAACSPLADVNTYEFTQFERDVRRIRGLVNDSDVATVNFTGGDVFGNPRLTDFFSKARELFPTSRISISTNGIALNKQTDMFFELCANYKVAIDMTNYPISHGFSINEMLNKSQTYGFEFNFFGDSSLTEDKSSWWIPFSMQGKQSPYDFLFCAFHRDSKNLMMIDKGILTPCGIMRQPKHLRKSFGEAPPLDESNFLKLDTIKDANELESFLAKRYPLCDYCAIRKRKSMGQWLPSKKEKSEWFVI